MCLSLTLKRVKMRRRKSQLMERRLKLLMHNSNQKYRARRKTRMSQRSRMRSPCIMRGILRRRRSRQLNSKAKKRGKTMVQVWVTMLLIICRVPFSS